SQIQGRRSRAVWRSRCVMASPRSRGTRMRGDFANRAPGRISGHWSTPMVRFQRVHPANPTRRPLLEVLEAAVRGVRVESGGPLCENARRNHTAAPRGDVPMQTRTPQNAATPFVAGALLGRLAASVRLAAPVPAEDQPAASAELDCTVRPALALAHPYRRWEF